MYGKGRQGRHVTPLDSVSKAIWSQMQKKKIDWKMKKIEDFTQFYPFLAIFYPLFVTEVIFQRGKSKKL